MIAIRFDRDPGLLADPPSRTRSNRRRAPSAPAAARASTPGYSSTRHRARPATFAHWFRAIAFISGEAKEDRTMVCLWCLARPSRCDSRTRMTSTSARFTGIRFTASRTVVRCCQFCIAITSAWSTMSTSMEARKSAAPGPPSLSFVARPVFCSFACGRRRRRDRASDMRGARKRIVSVKKKSLVAFADGETRRVTFASRRVRRRRFVLAPRANREHEVRPHPVGKTC